MFRNGLEPWHLLVLVALFVALFGYKRLPDAARSLGRSLRIFKTEMKGMSEDDKKRASEEESAPPAVDSPAPTAEDAPQPSNQDTGKAAS